MLVAVAHQVEHRIVTPEVAGSRPVGHPIFPACESTGKPGLGNLVETSDWFAEEDVHDPPIPSDGLHLAVGGHRIYKDRPVAELSKY